MLHNHRQASQPAQCLTRYKRRTHSNKQTNCFALPVPAELTYPKKKKVLFCYATCIMHTSTTNWPLGTTTNLLCMFLSPMLHASMYAQITPLFCTHVSLSSLATTGLTSCQTNWHPNHHSVAGRIDARTELMMRRPSHLPLTTHHASAGTAAVSEGPWYTGSALIPRIALGMIHAGWRLQDSSSSKIHTQNWTCMMN